MPRCHPVSAGLSYLRLFKLLKVYTGRFIIVSLIHTIHIAVVYRNK